MDFASCYQRAPLLLMEGALGERLKREYGLSPHPQVAWADLVRRAEGRKALKTLWQEYREIAGEYGLPFLATTPTRRANRERAASVPQGENLIGDNVAFLRSIAASGDLPLYVGGLMGCRGDAYRGDEGLSTREAHLFHRWGTLRFREAGADFLFAGIMPSLAEAVGMARAMAETGLPYLVSLMLSPQGTLLDGTPLHRAIETIDGDVDTPPLCYMSNCVHPHILYKALSQPCNRTPLVRRRFRGLQANASPLGPEELDGSGALRTSGPGELAAGFVKLGELLDLKIAGGCCGTDGSHIRSIAAALVKTR